MQSDQPKPTWLPVVILMLAVLPVALVHSPPMVDYPLHLARVNVLAGAPGPNEFYAPHWQPIPNLGMDVLMTLMLKVMPIDLASRAFLSLVTALLVGGTLLLHRRLQGAWHPSCVLAGLVAFDQWFVMGFTNYLLGFGLGLCLLAWLAPGPEGDWRPRWEVAIPALAALAVCHLMAAAVTALVFLGFALSHRFGADRALRNSTLVACGLALAFLAALEVVGKTPYAVETRGSALLQMLMPAHSGLASLSLLVLAAILSRGRLTVSTHARTPLALLLIVVLLGPSFLVGTAFTSERVTLPLLALAAASLAPMAALPVWAPLTVGLRFLWLAYAWFAGAADLDALRLAMGRLDERTPLFVVREGQPPWHSTLDLYRHAADWGSVDRNLFVPQLFVKPRQQPMKFREHFVGAKAFQGNDPLVFTGVEERERLLKKAREAARTLPGELPPAHVLILKATDDSDSVVPVERFEIVKL